MKYSGAAYRALHPRWSFAPLSGEGAAIHGGRFNPKGVRALYFGTTIEVAFLEATQGFAYKFSPLTMCSFEIDCDDIVDLRDDLQREAAGVRAQDMSCAWFSAIADGKRPASWAIHEQLKGHAAGILVPSYAPGVSPAMSNLVLWDWAATGPHAVTLHDPDRRLPRDGRSWE